jgi:hypothetical protein
MLTKYIFFLMSIFFWGGGWSPPLWVRPSHLYEWVRHATDLHAAFTAKDRAVSFLITQNWQGEGLLKRVRLLSPICESTIRTWGRFAVTAPGHHVVEMVHMQGRTNPGRRIPVATTFCAVVPDTCGHWVWNWLHVKFWRLGICGGC